jgi:hypothetical protein
MNNCVVYLFESRASCQEDEGLGISWEDLATNVLTIAEERRGLPWFKSTMGYYRVVC